MTSENLEFFNETELIKEDPRTLDFISFVENFDAFGTETRVDKIHVGKQPVPVFINEFWTSKQRAAHSLHEVSYRACFKPQLPRFFIDQLTDEGDVVLDPFMGRGTTLIEAVLRNRSAAGCDINPLSEVICAPRLNPPPIEKVSRRLDKLDLVFDGELPLELEVFFSQGNLEGIMCPQRILFRKR